MTIRRTILVAAALAWSLAAIADARGQDTPPAEESAEAGRRPVAAQMRRLFAARLRSDVGLDASQIDAVLPRIEALERSRGRALRERLGLLRELRRGLDTGVPDDELQRRLDALDRLGQDNEREARATLSEIDRDLTVPQRVRLRFLMARFRNEMTRRVKEFGGDPGGGAGPNRGLRRGAPPSAPPPTP